MVVREKILTMNNLRKISICIAEWCSTCKNSGEIYGSLSSPLCLCIKFMVLGVLFVRHHVVVPKQVVDLLACWKGFLVVIILQKCRYMGCYPTMYYVDYLVNRFNVLLKG